LTSAALFVTGLAAGVLGALLGLGGGVFLVPALTILFHLPVRVAVSTGLVGVIATSAGVAAMSRPGRSADVALALRLEVATAAGAMLGAYAAGVISARALNFIFAVVVFATAAYLYLKTRRRASDEAGEELFRGDYCPVHWPQGMAASSLAGVISGLLGMGCGFIKVPVMYTLMDVPLGVATATSNFMVGITAAASVFVYYGRGDILPLVAIPTVLGGFAGAVLGVTVQSRLRAAWLRTALIGLLVIIGFQMLWRGIQGG